ncbi:GNAT family N-acetyltransferase [Klebsiella aerogenes]|uniref:GNAT family N-acetyltransferase n=1 Tax=Klebsiella aerogenes TaxID=548 RepID=UPI0018662326
MKHWQNFIENNGRNNVFCFVESIENLVVGCTRLVVSNKICQKSVAIVGIFVDEEYRLNAVGNMLIEAVINFFRELAGNS